MAAKGSIAGKGAVTIGWITVAASLVPRQGPDVADKGSLQLKEALVHVGLAVVLELRVQGRVLRVQEDGHPLFAFKVVLGLEQLNRFWGAV